MLSEISKGRRIKPPSEIYRPGDLLPYTLREIIWKYALLLGQCRYIYWIKFFDIFLLLNLHRTWLVEDIRMIKFGKTEQWMERVRPYEASRAPNCSNVVINNDDIAKGECKRAYGLGSQCRPNECLFGSGKTPGGRDFGWGATWAGEGNEGSQFTSNPGKRWTDPVTARRVPSKCKGTNKGSKGIIMYIAYPVRVCNGMIAVMNDTSCIYMHDIIMEWMLLIT